MPVDLNSYTEREDNIRKCSSLLFKPNVMKEFLEWHIENSTGWYVVVVACLIVGRAFIQKGDGIAYLEAIGWVVTIGIPLIILGYDIWYYRNRADRDNEGV